MLMPPFFVRPVETLQFVAAGTVITGGSPTVPPPAAAEYGDLLLLISTSATITTNTIAGWTLIVDSSNNRSIKVWTKIHSGVESSVSITAGAANGVHVMLAYRGAGATAAYSTSNGNSATATTTSITTGADGTFVVSILGCEDNPTSMSLPAGVTSRVYSVPDATHGGLRVVDEPQTTAGATAPRSSTLSSSHRWVACAIELRQAT